MTRRHLLTVLALLFGSIVGFPTATPAAAKAKPLQVTYYYLPG